MKLSENVHLDTQIIDDNYIKAKKASLAVDAYN
ncbi:hypothetical protein IFVP408_C2120222 [Vibrio parahaemolyticus]